MKLQYLCHLIHACGLAVCTAVVMGVPPAAADSPPAAGLMHDYPTVARVEYVNECMARNGGKLAAMYQCACAIDRIATALTYDDFVEASTYAKYATLPGEGGGIFRDSDHAKKLAKDFRSLEADSLRACGMPR